MTDAEMLQPLEQRFVGIASCSTCGICRQVAEMALASIAEHREARAAASNEGAEMDRVAAAARLEC